LDLSVSRIVMRTYRDRETASAKDLQFYLRRSGECQECYLDVSCSPVHDEVGGVDGVLCILNETTERVSAIRRLAKSESRMASALDASGKVGTSDYDISAGAARMRDNRSQIRFALATRRFNAGGVEYPRTGRGARWVGQS
jgi:hypothetical protein